MPLNRRSFCSLTAASLAATLAPGQEERPTARPDVARIDRSQIFTIADSVLHAPVETLNLTPLPTSVGKTLIDPNDLFVSSEERIQGGTQQTREGALLAFTRAVPALAAAVYLTQEENSGKAADYAKAASVWCDAWFVAPATRMTPTFATARLAPDTFAPQPQGIAEGAALAEIAKALPFLVSTGLVTEAQQTAWKGWYRDLADWLDTARLAGLARDSKDHTGSSWLLLRISAAVLLDDQRALTTLRHQFKTATLRAQIHADGTFPHELSTQTPYRNSLFNLDLLAACADLLSTRFESAWDYELQDGPGMRAAIACHAPWIAHRSAWPYPADTQLFNQLPARRPALLLAARALQQAEYATIWRSLDPEPTAPALLRTFPLRQPLLWTVRPRPLRQQGPTS